MLHLDDVQLYELSEAGPLLFRDPVRLAREARLRSIPSARIGPALGLPAAWVEAETGTSGADPASVAAYWLGRLAPPAPGARKPRRARDRLPAPRLLTPEEAARRLFATPAALERLDRDGRMPSLRVDGAVRYDEELVTRMAAEADEPAAAEARRAEVRAWARFEYDTAAAAAPATPTATSAAPTAAPAAPTSETPVGEEPERHDEPAPAAFEIPADLGLDALEPLEGSALGGEPTSDLLDIEGFDTVDED